MIRRLVANAKPGYALDTPFMRTIEENERISVHAGIEHPESVEILGVPVHMLDRGSLTSLLGHLPNGERQVWISYANVHAVNLAQEFPWLKDFLRHSLVTYCDGAGLRLGSKILGKTLPERITLTDWIYDVCRVAEERQWRVFLLGSTDFVLQESVKRLQSKYPTLRVVGSHHGYFPSEEDQTVVSMINSRHADLLIVAMGMARQERWILDNTRSLDVPIVMNAGSCFDYLSGEKRRCPKWMGNIGMEWLFRLAQEPRRLWKRYLFGNPLFLFRVVRARFIHR